MELAYPPLLHRRSDQDRQPRRSARLEHDLAPHLSELASFARRRDLERSRLFARLRPELERVCTGFEWRLDPPTPSRRRTDAAVHAVAWNIERGKQLDAIVATLRTDSRLASADLLCLTELDIGMARSGNVNVVQHLADELGMAYVFANFHLVLSPGDQGEREQRQPNTTSLHGCALLSRFPIRRFDAVDLPERVDKFEVLEKRLGNKRSLLAEVDTPRGPLTVIVPHLDPFADGRHRGNQMARTLAAASRFGGERWLLGGDLNTNTYHLGSARGLAWNFTYKMLRLGFDRTIEQYLTPGEIFERPVFTALAEYGYLVDAFNDLDKGTYHYDMCDPDLVRKTHDYVPRAMVRWLERRLEPWNGSVPMRLDWFAGRGLRAHAPWVLEHPRHRGARASDHHPLGVSVDW